MHLLMLLCCLVGVKDLCSWGKLLLIICQMNAFRAQACINSFAGKKHLVLKKCPFLLLRRSQQRAEFKTGWYRTNIHVKDNYLFYTVKWWIDGVRFCMHMHYQTSLSPWWACWGDWSRLCNMFAQSLDSFFSFFVLIFPPTTEQIFLQLQLRTW